MTHLLRKQITWLPLLLAFTLLLAACQGNQPEPTVTPAPTVAPAATTAPTTETITETETVTEAETVTETEAATETEAITDTEAITETTAPTTAESSAAPAASGETKTFVFGEGTEARFYIDEVLMGQDKNVVGVTAQVQGEITLDPTAPASAQISPITIAAGDFTTDSDRRNGAIQRFILQTDQYQTITFEPTAITGLPETVTVGQPVEFTVTGNLTIREITREETFQVTVTPVSETEISGLGTATIQRANYELTIPSVPSVANVSEDIVLEIAFVAAAS